MMKFLSVILSLWLLGLAACWSYREAGEPQKTQTQQELVGRVYLGGTETYRFIGLQLPSGRAIVLLGADSLQQYQNRQVRVRGRFMRANSDSFLVKQVHILNQP